MSSRDDVSARILDAMRDVIAGAVLTNEVIARSMGLNVVDLQTLSVLLRVGHPLSPGELATRTQLPPSTITRILDRLEHAGLARRSPDPSDRRRVVVESLEEAFTRPDGQDPYADIVEGMNRLHERFSVEELAVVARYLEAVRDMGRPPSR